MQSVLPGLQAHLQGTDLADNSIDGMELQCTILALRNHVVWLPDFSLVIVIVVLLQKLLVIV